MGQRVGLCSSRALWPRNRTIFVQIICWTPLILQVQSSELPSIFLRAQPWRGNHRALAKVFLEVVILRVSQISETSAHIKSSKHQIQNIVILS